jgi:hypothetical protein
MTRHAILLVIGAALVSAATIQAHHSQAAQYDRDKQITVQGTIVQFQYRNPHSFLHIEAPDAGGQMVRWSIEWGGAAQLTMQGVERTTLKYGDVVVITANPSRTPNDHKLQIVALRRPSDGFGWGNKPGQVVD